MVLSTHFARLFWLGVVIFFCSFPISAQAHYRQYKQIIVFGDSLVDVGNVPATTFIQTLPTGELVPGLVIPPPTRYDRGRFSNGPVIVDYLVARSFNYMKPSETGFNLKKDNVSYAFGGSETGFENFTPGMFIVPGLIGQVLKFEEELKGRNVNFSNSLFIVWSGANDYFNKLAFGGTPDPTEIVNNIFSSVEKLTKLGAKKIVVINLPNLGMTPMCQILSACDLLSSLTDTHNNMLENVLQDQKGIIFFDVHSIIEKIMKNPARFGFSNNIGLAPGAGCLFQIVSEFDIGNCSSVSFNTNSIFWDEVHPTTKIHKILAKKLRRKLRHHWWSRYSH